MQSSAMMKTILGLVELALLASSAVAVRVMRKKRRAFILIRGGEREACGGVIFSERVASGRDFFFGVNDEPVAGDESGVRPKFDTGDGRDVGAWAGCGIGG